LFSLKLKATDSAFALNHEAEVKDGFAKTDEQDNKTESFQIATSTVISIQSEVA
jgi:hypothetical protein